MLDTHSLLFMTSFSNSILLAVYGVDHFTPAVEWRSVQFHTALCRNGKHFLNVELNVIDQDCQKRYFSISFSILTSLGTFDQLHSVTISLIFLFNRLDSFILHHNYEIVHIFTLVSKAIANRTQMHNWPILFRKRKSQTDFKFENLRLIQKSFQQSKILTKR